MKPGALPISPAEQQAVAPSDALTAETTAADVLVIAVPVYVFGVPAARKAWIGQMARAGAAF